MSEIAIISTREVIYESSFVKYLVDIGELDLDAMVHDYDYINGANRNFIKKWEADIKYI